MKAKNIILSIAGGLLYIVAFLLMVTLMIGNPEASSSVMIPTAIVLVIAFAIGGGILGANIANFRRH